MLAIIKTGGKQYLVKKGDKIKIEKINKPKGEEIVFEEILLLQKKKELKIGQPFVKDAKVIGKILEQDKHKKITILKHRPRTRYKKKMGHRQPYSEVEITKIS